MKDYVEKIELENYWENPPVGIHPDLAKMLDELIKKGSYTKWVFGLNSLLYTTTLRAWWTYAHVVKWY